MAGEYAISLVSVTKQHGAKTVLEDVNLSFFHGAHIGVIGVNGSGKSSLLKILAGEDKEVGEYKASVKIYKAINASFKFNVVAE